MSIKLIDIINDTTPIVRYKSFRDRMLEEARKLKKENKNLRIWSDSMIAFKDDKTRNFILTEMLKTVQNANVISNIVKNEFKGGNSIEVIVNKNEKNKLINDIYINIPYEYVSQTELISNRLNTLGWFTAAIYIPQPHNLNLIKKKYKTISLIDTILNEVEKDKDSIVLSLEPKYDYEVDRSILTNIYHITFDLYYYGNEKYTNRNKIKDIGLAPKSKAKKAFHPNRIYFLVDTRSIDSLAQELYDNSNIHIRKDIEKAIVLKIDTSKLSKDIKFYADLNMPGGIYTNDNIGPNNIEIYREINIT